MNLRKKLVGKRVYGTRVDITDPCYDSDTWCRINNVKIKAGEYTCRVWTEKINMNGREKHTNTPR